MTQHIYTQAMGLLTCLELFEAKTGRDTLYGCRPQSGVTLDVSPGLTRCDSGDAHIRQSESSILARGQLLG